MTTPLYELINLETKSDMLNNSDMYVLTYTTDGVFNVLNVASDHPNYEKIADCMLRLVDAYDWYEDFADDDCEDCTCKTKISDIISEIVSLNNIGGEVSSRITDALEELPGLDGRLTVSGSTVYMDCEPIHPALENHIIRLMRSDEHKNNTEAWTSFIKFMEKLYANPDADVRWQLYGWLEYMNEHTSGFTLTESGNIIGYKGCAGSIEEPTSINTGTAFVNGVKHTGSIPNPIGAVVAMPRSEVQNDPSVGCSSGLHVGTYDYASSWSRGVLLHVEVDPRDIVSVPTECEAQKMRVCRYRVVDVCEGPDNTPLYESMEAEGCFCGDEDCDDCCDTPRIKLTVNGEQSSVDVTELFNFLFK